MTIEQNRCSSTQTTAEGAAHDPSLERLLIAVLDQQRPRLLSFFLRGMGAETPAEDLLQETVLRAWRHRAALVSDPSAPDEDARDGARRYLWRVARNLMIDEIRRRRRRRAREDVSTDPSTADPASRAAEQAIELEDSLRVIRETVSGLDNHRARRCVELWIGGCDPHAIAAQLGLAAGQVRGLLQRGRSEIVRRAGDRLGVPLSGPRGCTQTGG